MRRYILFIDSMNSGGAQRQMANLAVLMESRRIPFDLICYHPINKYRGLLEPHGISPVCLGDGSKTRLVMELVRHVRKSGSTHIISFLFTPSFIALLVGLLLPDLKVIVGERSFEANTPVFHRHVTRRLYFRADAIATNSRAQFARLRERFGSSRLYYIPNGIPESQFVSAIPEKSGLTIVSIGRVSPLKNTHGLIEAISSADLRDSGIEVVWLGDYSEYHDYYLECCALLEERSLASRWTWAGVVPDVDGYLDRARVLYHGSFGEGFPNAICESLARGVPVIASDVFDHAEFVKDGQNGFLFRPDSVEELTDKLVHLSRLGNAEYSRMAEQSVVTARRSFLVENTLSEYLELA